MMPADCAAIARRRVSRRAGCDFDELHQVAQIAAWRAPVHQQGAAAKRAIIDHCRRETHSRRTHGIPHRALEWQERADDMGSRIVNFTTVERAMRQLPARWQHAIRLRYWHGHTLAEVGRMLGCGEPRAFQIVRDSLLRMREVLA